MMRCQGFARLSVVTLGICLAACGHSQRDEAPRAAVVQQPLGVSGGGVPLPVLPCPEPPEPGSFCEPAAQGNWDGTYADLLAADALAECALLDGVGADNALDDGLQRLRDLMTSASCPLGDDGGNSGLVATYHTWWTQRREPLCNVNPVTGTPQSLDEKATASPPTADPAHYDAFLFPGELSEADLARGHMQGAVNNLCMAKKLQEHLDSAQVIFASTEELERIHSLVRDRALAAVLLYSVAAKSLAADPDADGDGTDDFDPDVVPGTVHQAMLRWRALADGDITPPIDGPTQQDAIASLTRFGSDFALAIELLVDATRSATELVLRDGLQGLGSYELIERRPLDASIAAPPNETEMMRAFRGARTRAFTLAYGDSSDMSDPAREHQWANDFLPFPLAWPRLPLDVPASVRASATATSGAGVQALLGLARAADAFVLTADQDAPGAIDVWKNARALYHTVEQHVRSNSSQCMDADADGVPDGRDAAPTASRASPPIQCGTPTPMDV